MIENDVLQRAFLLLEIAEKCTGHSGKLSSLQSAVIGELIAINSDIKAEAVEAAKASEAEKAKQAEAQAAADAEQNAKGVPATPGVPEDANTDTVRRL